MPQQYCSRATNLLWWGTRPLAWLPPQPWLLGGLGVVSATREETDQGTPHNCTDKGYQYSTGCHIVYHTAWCRGPVCRLVQKGPGKIAALLHELVKLPAAPELEEIGQRFQQLANSPVFLRCADAIDGCHVCVKTPSGPSGLDYINNKLFLAIQLQAVCDWKGQFLLTFVGYPEPVHDTHVLKNSSKEAL